MSAESAAEMPIHIIESGPAAGVIASLTLAERVGLTNVLTLDMGGTTAKASLIEDGQIMHSPEYQVGGACLGRHPFEQRGRLSVACACH